MKITENMYLIKAAQILVEGSKDDEFHTLITTLLHIAAYNATKEELTAIAIVYKELGEMYDYERKEAIKKSLTIK